MVVLGVGVTSQQETRPWGHWCAGLCQAHRVVWLLPHHGAVFRVLRKHHLSQATLVLVPFAMKGHVFKVLVRLNHSCLGHCSSSSCLLRLFPDPPNSQPGLEPLLPWLPILCLGTRVSSRALACMSLHAYTRVVAHTASFLWGPRAWSLLPHLSSPTLIFRVCLPPNPV